MREYDYRLIFSGLTHEQYLDEDQNLVEWMLRIHQIRRPKQGGSDGMDRPGGS